MHVSKFVIHVTKFVTKTILYERKNYLADSENYLADSNAPNGLCARLHENLLWDFRLRSAACASLISLTSKKGKIKSKTIQKVVAQAF